MTKWIEGGLWRVLLSRGKVAIETKIVQEVKSVQGVLGKVLYTVTYSMRIWNSLHKYMIESCSKMGLTVNGTG
jgi:hypothetical protein